VSGWQAYPLRLRVDGRLAVVVGGGPEAARHAAGLRSAGAAVRLVAPDRYREADLDGAWLALACADQPAVNSAVAADAERRRLWCVGADADAGPEAGPAAGPDAGTHRGRVLVLGGARSGKSTTAERFLAAHGAAHSAVDYVATGMPPGEDDAEWAARVAEHRGRRPAHWRTTETLDLEQVLKSDDPAPVLVDCLSLWLARVLDECGVWAADGDGGDSGAEVTARVDRLVRAWRDTSRHVVAVSNEVGCGVVPATASGRRYRDELGRLNALIAAGSDEVWFCTAGIPRRLR
jgi:adenosylcobinamide kinase / adenosylcobinamide-phosphate guanylyltransferase